MKRTKEEGCDNTLCKRQTHAHQMFRCGTNTNKHFTSKLGLELRNKLVKHYIWGIAVYGAETWTLRAVDQKHLESFEMLCWRRMEEISWTDHVRNEEILFRAKKQRNILHERSKRKAYWIGHILHRNCLLRQCILKER
jgi:hypothetical protein